MAKPGTSTTRVVVKLERNRPFYSEPVPISHCVMSIIGSWNLFRKRLLSLSIVPERVSRWNNTFCRSLQKETEKARSHCQRGALMNFFPGEREEREERGERREERGERERSKLAKKAATFTTTTTRGNNNCNSSNSCTHNNANSKVNEKKERAPKEPGPGRKQPPSIVLPEAGKKASYKRNLFIILVQTTSQCILDDDEKPIQEFQASESLPPPIRLSRDECFRNLSYTLFGTSKRQHRLNGVSEIQRRRTRP